MSLVFSRTSRRAEAAPPRLPEGADGNLLAVTVTPAGSEPRTILLDLRRGPDGDYLNTAHPGLLRSLRDQHGREALQWEPTDEAARPGYEERRAARRAAAAAKGGK